MHYFMSCLGTRNKLIGARHVAVVIVYRSLWRLILEEAGLATEQSRF